MIKSRWNTLEEDIWKKWINKIKKDMAEIKL